MTELPRTACLELRFSPNIDLVTTIRTFVSQFYEQVLRDPKLTSRVAVASHELLENAVKYSTDGETKMLLEVSYSERDVGVRLEMKNRASRQNVETLTRLFDEMGRTSPDAFYMTLMERSLSNVDGSCLGIGRIAAETDMALALDVDGDVVCVRAQKNWPRMVAA